MSKRDALTTALFNCQVKVLHESTATQFLLNGHVLDTAAFAKLTGAPDGSYMLPVITPGGDLEIEVAHDDIIETMQRTVQQGAHGFQLVSNDILVIKKEFRGLGIAIRSFAIEAREAQRLGIAKIKALAAGKVGDEFSGWYLWVRAGFQADLDAAERALLAGEAAPALRAAQTLHDLMRTQEGVDWWRSHGRGRQVEFDLAPASAHWDILNLYLAEKGVII